MVFVVSPMPGGEHHVESVARTINEFLAMVLYCKGASPIEQISWMTEEQYIDLIKEEYSYNWEEREEALNALREDLGIEEITDVYNTIKRIQAEFNYAVIPFSEDYRLSE